MFPQEIVDRAKEYRAALEGYAYSAANSGRLAQEEENEAHKGALLRLPGHMENVVKWRATLLADAVLAAIGE